MIPLPTWLRGAVCAFAILSAVPVAARPVATAAEVRPGLWKVADEDTTIWLFGTIHVLPEAVDWHTGKVAAAFDESRELVTEIPIDETEESQGAMAAASLRKDGKALRATLSPPLRAKYDAALKTLKLPVAAFDRNDTWFAALLITLLPLREAGYNSQSGVDAQVADRAKARGMTNHAFETAEYQIGLFENLPQKTQRSYLAEVIKSLPTVKQDVGAMVAAWKSGDADELAKLLNEDESDPVVRKVLLTNRNIAWAKWLKARLAKPGTVFVAVGAGHLAGHDSVQQQLAAAGVASTRVQ